MTQDQFDSILTLLKLISAMLSIATGIMIGQVLADAFLGRKR